jgi:hypothetical protein
MKRIYLVISISFFLNFISIDALRSQCTFTNSVPYFEGFSTLTANNQLPLCWATSSTGTNCLTYTTGGGYSAFFDTPIGTHYFYTNAIQLNAGVTYSTGLIYRVSNSSGSAWTGLSIQLGNTQTPVGQSTLATTSGTITNTVFNSLSNTFSVPISGIYYVSIKATSNSANSPAPYLYFDDLFVLAPCNLTPNTPTLSVTGPTAICSGNSVTLTASGASSYSLNTTAFSTSIVVTPILSDTYLVSGTNTLSACTATLSKYVGVNPKPSVSIFTNLVAPSNKLCIGSTANLSGTGATSYTWSINLFTNTISVSPIVNTIYTLIGSNQSGCINSTSLQLLVSPLPTVSASSSSSLICVGETVTLTASGAMSYAWSSGSLPVSNALIAMPSPTIFTIYNVIGTDANNCANSKTISVNVDACTSIKINNALNVNYKIYPNPTSEKVTLEFLNNEIKSISIINLMGEMLYKQALSSEEDKFILDMSRFSNGIYFISIESENTIKIVKIVKE